MTDFRYSVNKQKIALIEWDVPNTKMNVLSLKGMVDFEVTLDKALNDSEVKGIIITSAKKDFSGGMDLNVLTKIISSEKNFELRAFETLTEIHNILRKLEVSGRDTKKKIKGKPVVWMCSGVSAGIGTEIGLACHYRIASDISRTKIGLPEILVGLFPFGGGTTRVSRMIGAMAAAPILLEGRMMNARAAKSAGIIDEVVEEAKLLERASEWILTARDDDIIKPWDKRNYKMPGGSPYTKEGFMTFVGASAMVHGRSQGVYPAPKSLLSAIYEGAMVPFETALKIEARWAIHLMKQPSTTNMIRSLFISKTALDKGAARPKNIANQSVRKLGIVGAGMMGSGIAYVAAMAGIRVVLLDKDTPTVNSGKLKIEKILLEGVKRKKTTESKMLEVLKLVEATSSLKKIEGCDLVIEAVFEDLEVKETITKKLEVYLDDKAIFASNTSTLPISELAKASCRAGNFIGIHFFSPVNKMNLVEIIRGSLTSDTAVAKAIDFVAQIKKTPIVVKDARFFYANRCIIPYINEGVTMVGEGVSPALIENCAKQLGMPIGPLQLIDETSIDLAVQIASATKKALGKKYNDNISDEVLEVMARKNRLGRKVNAGFYDYDQTGKRIGLWADLKTHWENKSIQPCREDVTNRLALIQVLEAVRSVEEGVLLDIREGDVGAILGWGCLTWAGGPFGWLDITGSRRVINICSNFEKNYGSRFKAPKLLKEISKKNTTFYEHFMVP